MTMSIDFQFLYDNPFSLPYISYKMKYASIILDVCHQILLLITVIKDDLIIFHRSHDYVY